DLGQAAEYDRAKHPMLQQPETDDYVIATGETHSVREFCERAFAEADLDYHDYVKTDERFYRAAEVDLLLGDSTKARKVLGWEPRYTFRELVREMVRTDLESVASGTTMQVEAFQSV